MKEDFLSKLDNGQLKAAISGNSRILCLAGAGSGKTRVLTTRIFYLIHKLKVKPENILAITFTKAAACEMLLRLSSLGVDIKNLWCRTFHSACYRILKEVLSKKETLRNFEVADQATQDKIMKQCVADLQKNRDFAYNLNSFAEENNWTLDLFFEEAYKVVKECKSRFISTSDLAEKAREVRDDEAREFLRLVYFIFKLYQKRLKKLNIFDFSDLMNQTISLLKNNGAILNHYQKRFKFILVDEFQDVNLSQIRLLELLCGARNNLFVVGDDWQSIYGFRGGNVRYILDFRKTYRDCENIILPYNYRSDRNIVDATSRVIRNNSRQMRKKIKAFHPDKIKINIVRAKDKTQGDKFVMDTTKKLIREGVKQKDIMILGRTWRQLAIFLENLPKIGLKEVRITTVHGAKGQEAKVVFIVGLTCGRGGFPYIKDDYEIIKVIRETNKNERLEEERRVFYVAMTRAKERLFLVTERDNESRFIREVSRRYVREIS